MWAERGGRKEVKRKLNLVGKKGIMNMSNDKKKKGNKVGNKKKKVI